MAALEVVVAMAVVVEEDAGAAVCDSGNIKTRYLRTLFLGLLFNNMFQIVKFILANEVDMLPGDSEK
jgi:hypothetical protein